MQSWARGMTIGMPDGEPDDAVAAQAVAQERGLVRPALDVVRAGESFLHFRAELVRLVVQPLRHQDDVHDVLRAGRAEIRLALQDFARDQLKPFGPAGQDREIEVIEHTHPYNYSTSYDRKRVPARKSKIRSTNFEFAFTDSGGPRPSRRCSQAWRRRGCRGRARRCSRRRRRRRRSAGGPRRGPVGLCRREASAGC